MNKVKGGVVRRIAVQMKQRQCRGVAHASSIFEPAIVSHGGGKDEASHDRAGLPNLLEWNCDLLLALLLLTRLLVAALLATLLLLAGLLVWILIHRSFLSNIGSPLRSLVFHGKSQSAANAFVPRFTLRQCVWNLSPRVEFPFATRRTDDGTLYAFVAAWGADSDSGARLAFWWPSLDA